MSDLADGKDLARFLGLTTAQIAAAGHGLDDKVDAAVALFEKLTRRTSAPFQSAEAGRIEIRDGIGQPTLLLDYPVDTLTAVILGVDLTNPTTTITVADPAQVVWRKGSRLIRRMGTCPAWQVGWRTPGFVQVTYDAQADLPADVRQAVLAMAASLYQEGLVATTGAIRSESETLDNYSRAVTYESSSGAGSIVGADDPSWLLAVKTHRRLVAV